MARKSKFSARGTETLSITTLPCAFYRRLSVEDGDDIEQNSLGNQWRIILDYLKDKSGLKVVETYTDNGYSGMNYDRPEFKRMMDDIRNGKIGCVIVKDISRLGRHFVSTSELVEKILPAMDVRLISVNDDYDSAEENADASALVLPFKMIMNDSYVKDISRKIRASINAKMNDGSYIPSCSSIPYGYLRNPEKQTYDIDPEAAVVVQRIFDLRAQGVKFNDIARKLNEDNIPCPGKLRYMRGITMKKAYADALWIRGTIRKITVNQAYIGNRVYGKVKRDKLGDEKKPRPTEEWIIVDKAHPPIVDEALFYRVQQINQDELAKRATFTKRAEPGMDYRDIFRGLVYCADCGGTMSSAKGCARPGEKRYSRIFYDCNRYRYSNHAECRSHYIRQEVIMNALTNLLDGLVMTCVDMEKLVYTVENMSKVQQYQSRAQDRLTSARAKRMNQEAKLEQLLIDLTEGVIDRDEFDYAKKRYNAALEELFQEEHDAVMQAEQLGQALATTQSWIRAVKRYQKLPDVNQEIVKMLVKDIRVVDSGTVHINLNFADPFAPLKEYLDRVDEVMQNAG